MQYILITGVSSGIGFDALKYFSNEGFYVFGSVRNLDDKSKLEQTFDKNFTCLVFDVTNLEDIQNSFNVVKQVMGDNPLAALVNNAGYAQGGPMALLSDKDFQKQMEVNLFGVRNVTNTFLPLLGASKDFKHKPGKIINISSISGILNTPMNGAYCVAKHALESMTEVYRRELMMYKIQLASIQPGPIQSKLWDKNIASLEKYYHGDYANMAKNTDRIILESSKDALPASVISKLIHKIIIKKSPKLSYVVTKNSFLATILAKYVPARVVDYFLNSSLNKQI